MGFGKKIRSSLFPGLFLILFTIQGFGQVMVTPTLKPLSLVICGSDGIFSMQIANTTGGTMGGAILTLIFPSGVRYSPGSVAGATELDISNLNQPVFTLPDIPNNSAHEVSYSAGLICGYTNSSNINYVVTFNANNYSGVETPLQNYYYPEPIIAGITNNPISIPLNSTVDRDITILQQGANAATDTVVILDQHSTDIQVVSVNVGTLHPYIGAGPIITDTIIVTGGDLPGGNGQFDEGELMIITESVKLVGCSDGQSVIKATWGCYKQYCAFNTAYAIVNVPPGSPGMNLSFTANRRGWGFIDNRGYTEFTVTNTGSGSGGIAYDVTVLAGFSSGGSTYYPNGNWINKIDSFSINGYAKVAGYNYASGALNGQYAYFTALAYTFDPDGNGVGLTDADGDGFFDDLPAGASFIIKAHTYYSWTQAVSTIPTGNSCGSGWTNSASQAFRYGYNFRNQCSVASGVNWVANSSVIQFQTYNTNTAQVDFPADIYGGIPEWFEQTVNTNTAVSAEGCSNDSVVYKVILPPGVQIYSPYTATFKGVSMGTPHISGDTVCYILSRSRILTGGVFRVPVVAICDIEHSLTAKIYAELKFWCDKTTFRNRFFTYWCADSPLFGFQCPLGNCPEPNISLFDITRHTLGWTNTRCTTRVTPSTPGIRLDNAITMDTLRIVAAGGINSNTDSLYFKLKHNAIGGNWGNQLFFDVLADTLHFYNIENDTWYLCTNLSPQVTNGSVSTLYSYFGNLTAPGGCLEGLTFTNGDSLLYILYGRVKNIAQQEWRTVPGLRASFFLKESNREAACNEKGANFHVLGNNFNFNAGTNYQQIIMQGCSTFVYEGLINRTFDVCGGDIAFPNEVRPAFAIDTLFFTLPEGFAYQPTSSIHRYYNDAGNAVNESIADPVVTVGPTGTRLMYLRTPDWNYSDYFDCWIDYDIIRFSAMPSCKATGNFNYTMDARGRKKIYADGIGIYQTSTSTKSITYTAPLMSLTTLIETAEGRQDSVHWTLSICNSRTFSAGNNWLGFESGNNGIQVVQVTDITDPESPVTIPVEGYGMGKYWVLLGTFTGNACRVVKITALYTACNYDSLQVQHGYNCAGYPINPDLGYPPTGYFCLQNTKWLYLDPGDISLNLSVASPVNPVDLCNTLEYEAQVTNSQLAYGYNLKFTVALPPGASIEEGFSEIKFPYTSGNWALLDDPVNQPAGSNKWVFDISGDPNGVELLKGSDSIPKNGYRLRFRIITNCNFTSGTSLGITASAASACGEIQLRTSTTDPIIINGIPTNINLYVINTHAPDSLKTCGNSSLLRIKVINLGPGSVSQIEKLGVNIDDAFDYVPNSLVGIHNGPTGLSGNESIGGIRYITFSIQPNLEVNDSIVFSMELQDIDPAGLVCDTLAIQTTTLLVAQVGCQSAPGGTCLIQSISSSISTLKPVIKDQLVFGGYTATSLPNGTSGEMITVQYRMINTGSAVLNGSQANVLFLYDTNGNGIADESASDSLCRQLVDVTGLLPGDSISTIVTFPVPSEKVCRILGVLRLPFNGCICGDETLSLNNIRLFNAGPDLSVCQQVPLPIGTDATAGYSYTWVPANYLSSNLIPNPIFLYNDLLTEPDTLSFTLLTVRPGNCTSLDTMQMIVSPAAIAFAGIDSTCCGGPPYFIADAIAVNHLSLLWSTSGTGTFDDETLQNPVYTPSADDITTGFVNLTMTTTGSCGDDSDATHLTFNPQLMASAGPDREICEQFAFFIEQASAQNSVGLTWSTAGDGDFNDPTLLNPIYYPGINDIASGWVVLSLDAIGIEPCAVVHDEMTLTLSPPPEVITFPLEKSICSDNLTNILLTSNQAGTIFHWTAGIVSGEISGFESGDGTVINDLLVNHGMFAGLVSYTVTPDNAGCIGDPTVFTVEIKPLPVLTNDPNTTALCSSGTTAISLEANITGSSFSWNASGSSSEVFGFSADDGAIIAQTLFNSGVNTEYVTYHVTPTLNGCYGLVTDLLVPVFPIPEVSISPENQTICGNTRTSLSLSSEVQGTTYTWSAVGSSPQVTGYADGSGDLIEQKLKNLGVVFETVTYSVLPVANGCSGSTTGSVVIVKPLAIIHMPACFDLHTLTAAQPLFLKGATPYGGWYSGEGVDTVTSLFYPVQTGTGLHKVYYNYRNMHSCNNRDSINILVHEASGFLCGQNLIDIRDNSSYPTFFTGTQCWMAASLNYGTTIAEHTHQSDNCTREKYVRNPFPGKFYAYYQWDELMDYGVDPGKQGLCPPGWHVPTAYEWQLLLDASQGSGIAGGVLKDLFTVTGFHGVLNGIRYKNEAWFYTETDAVSGTMYWSSTLNGTKPVARGINSLNQSVSLYEGSPANGFQVRCVKD